MADKQPAHPNSTAGQAPWGWQGSRRLSRAYVPMQELSVIDLERGKRFSTTESPVEQANMIRVARTIQVKTVEIVEGIPVKGSGRAHQFAHLRFSPRTGIWALY